LTAYGILFAHRIAQRVAHRIAHGLESLYQAKCVPFVYRETPKPLPGLTLYVWKAKVILRPCAFILDDSYRIFDSLVSSKNMADSA
jgi:hypothetical protein